MGDDAGRLQDGRPDAFPPAAPSAAAPSPPSTVLLAWTAGLTVANLYYNQPLLPDIARALHASERAAGLVSTATQVGYAIGLVLFVPLGDLLERRRLMVGLTVAVAIALAGAAAAPGIGWLVAASLAIGITTVVPQLILPYAAGLASPERRARVVGSIMGGLLVGILAARVIAGALGAVLGWRAVFAIAAGTMVVMALVLQRALEPAPPRGTMRYTALMRSLGQLARTEPVVRDAAFLGALAFLAFSAFWTTLAFRLQAPPLHYGSTVAGMFGLVGIAGAGAAPLVGRLSHRASPRRTVALGFALLTVSYLVFWGAGHTLVGLVAGVIVVDAAMQVVGVSNQARIYALAPEIHSRLNTIYMGTYFVGGALGSALGAWAWQRAGWTGVCLVCLAAMAAAWGRLMLRGGDRG